MKISSKMITIGTKLSQKGKSKAFPLVGRPPAIMSERLF